MQPPSALGPAGPLSCRRVGHEPLPKGVGLLVRQYEAKPAVAGMPKAECDTFRTWHRKDNVSARSPCRIERREFQHSRWPQVCQRLVSESRSHYCDLLNRSEENTTELQ